MVRVLITGARGGLGTALAERLSRPGLSLAPTFPGTIEVTALGRTDLDITRRDQVTKAIADARPDLILNAAGFTHVDLAESHQWEAFLVNRDGAEHVARAAAKAGAFVVYLSTDLVFDGAKRSPYSEEDPPNPLSIYADTKLAGELATMAHAPRHLIVRSGWIFGHAGRHFLRPLQDGLSADEILFGYEDQVGQPTYIEHWLDAVLTLVTAGRPGTFHVSSSGGATQFDALKKAVTMVGAGGVEVRAIRHTVGGRQAMRPRFSVLACGRAEQAGIAMKPWEAGLSEFVERIRSTPRSQEESRETQRRIKDA